MLRVRTSAALRSSHLEMEIAADVQLGRRVSVDIDFHSSPNRLVLAEGSRVQDDVVLWLRGGTIVIGPMAEVRRAAALDSSGHLEVGRDAMIGRGVALHCDRSVDIGTQAVVAEYAVVTDSRHLRTPAGVNLLHHVTSSATRVGAGAWIGAHAIVTDGVEVGAAAFIGAGAVVTSDVPAQWLAVGSPARLVRQVQVEQTT
jgi:acetyltransferase-like isoleucine patch superfamily enzyme